MFGAPLLRLGSAVANAAGFAAVCALPFIDRWWLPGLSDHTLKKAGPAQVSLDMGVM